MSADRRKASVEKERTGRNPALPLSDKKSTVCITCKHTSGKGSREHDGNCAWRKERNGSGYKNTVSGERDCAHHKCIRASCYDDRDGGIPADAVAFDWNRTGFRFIRLSAFFLCRADRKRDRCHEGVLDVFSVASGTGTGEEIRWKDSGNGSSHPFAASAAGVFA